MAEVEVITLRKTLYKQAHSIQELYDELDKERKLAASGADEALSMIFRLQEERDAEKIKASQYKRITEAKMLHAEDSLASLKNSVHEKENEINTLKFQLQSYRQNMHRFGIVDTDTEEIKVFNNNRRVRRHNSMPASWFDTLNLKMDIVDKSRPLVLTLPSIQSEYGDCSKQKREPRVEFFSNKSFVDEVTFGSDKLKSFAADNTSQQTMRVNTLCFRDITRNCAVYSQSNSESLSELNVGCLQINSKCRSSSCSTGETIHSTIIQDIYEVPKSSYGDAVDEYCECDSCKASVEEELKAFTGSYVESYTTPMTMQNEWKHSTLENGASIDPLRSDFEQLKERVKRIENDQRIMVEESKRKDEQLNLLMGVREQMNLVQSQTKVSKSKISQQDEILLMSITEALLSFAL